VNVRGHTQAEYGGEAGKHGLEKRRRRRRELRREENK